MVGFSELDALQGYFPGRTGHFLTLITAMKDRSHPRRAKKPRGVLAGT
jgi:hypothetical protein